MSTIDLDHVHLIRSIQDMSHYDFARPLTGCQDKPPVSTIDMNHVHLDHWGSTVALFRA